MSSSSSRPQPASASCRKSASSHDAIPFQRFVLSTTRRVLLLAGALALTLGRNAHAQSRSVRIRDFDAIIYVHTDGSITVAENLTIGFTGKWNGIVRDLSLRHNTAQ